MTASLLLSCLLGPLLSGILTKKILPKWIVTCYKNQAVWEDMNKWGTPKNVASCGGLVVIGSSVVTIFLITNFPSFHSHQKEILALLCTVSFTSLIGLTDDMLGWKNGGLPWQPRTLLALCASLPLLTANPTETISLPLFGTLHLGPVYLYILVPLGVAGATSSFNFLAGFNGLEAGQSLLILITLSILAYTNNLPWICAISLTFVGSICIFYQFNKYPAKVFPGDVFTWGIGALIASLSILGNLEKAGLLLFSLYFLETFLKVCKGKLQKQSFGIPQQNGTLKLPYKKIYGLTHLSLLLLQSSPFPPTEKNVVRVILTTQTAICILTLLLFI